jgi:putative ATPase
MGKKLIPYDKKSDQHYDCISAFIKSMRGSDPDAALYYCARMLSGGEDPVFIARRMIIFASEDIGNAEPRALPLALACLQAVEAIGMPECRINLGHVVTFLASCPKSNRAYLAINQAMSYVERTGSPELPQSFKIVAKKSRVFVSA